MVRLMLSLCLTGAAMCSSVTLHVAPRPLGYVQPRYTVALNSKQGKEVHSVVVDMPKFESLEFASPDTWYRLPTEALPD
jgi:hypothetical protein